MTKVTQGTPGAMTLLPPAKDVCQACATDHGEANPHNWDSLYYHMRFKMVHGRDPTWFDCVAHLNLPPAKLPGIVNPILERVGRKPISLADFPIEAIAEDCQGRHIGDKTADGTFTKAAD